MSRVIYNVEGLFVGPSGHNFLSYEGGQPHNDYSNPLVTHNLIKQLDRIQSFSYDISIPHTQVNQMNTRSVLDRPIINPPEVTFSFDYLLSDVSNESKMGLYVNYPQFEEPYSGAPFFSNNTGQSLLSGFVEEDEMKDVAYQAGQTDPFFPSRSYRDKKNFYLAVRGDHEDINTGELIENLTSRDNQKVTDLNATGYNVIALGRCYMDSYSTEASVGSLPRAQVSYTAENIMFETSGSGFLTPMIEAKSGNQLAGVDCVIPKMKNRNPISVLRPGDINFSVDSFSGMGIDFENLHLESYSISFEIPRGRETNLGHKFPISRKVNFTAPVQIGIAGVVEKMSSGSLIDLINLNQDYNFTINLNMPSDCSDSVSSDPTHAGTNSLERREGPMIKYSFNKAKLDGFNYGTAIGDNKSFEATFSTELDPDDLSKGFFISGFLADRQLEEFHLLETDHAFDGSTGDFERFRLELEESSGLLVSNYIPLY
tara:strand:+ start:7573 stop:9024 length:1452 start_codon:yes stop_codon:yes gene_type:complete